MGSLSQLLREKFRMELWMLKVQGTRGGNLENEVSVTERLGSFLFGLLSSLLRLLLFQKEPFNHSNMKESKVRKVMFSSLGSVS